MLKASFYKHTLNFKRPSGTSRGVLNTKDSWIIEIWDDSNLTLKGTGEASIIKTLSPEWNNKYEGILQETCENIHHIDLKNLAQYPSIRFGIEMALLDLKNGGNKIYFDNAFTQGEESILINGLIWMGEPSFMLEQIQQKVEQGFGCIKMKIGAIDFDAELAILKSIRKEYSAEDIELRVDANGAFAPEEAMSKLQQLSLYDLHSIEQPIKAGQLDSMAELCHATPLDIALDEELIGITNLNEQETLLQKIKPQYIILKPSLLGGFEATDQWINLAEANGIKWWITSALESNIGLTALAQYTFQKGNKMPQGLGTGGLYTNNIPCNLNLHGDKLWNS